MGGMVVWEEEEAEWLMRPAAAGSKGKKGDTQGHTSMRGTKK